MRGGEVYLSREQNLVLRQSPQPLTAVKNTIMKVFIAIAALFAASAQAGLIGHSALHSGSSVSSRSEDGLGNYKFSYDEKHATGGSFRSEAGGHHGVVGSFGLHDIDGRQRVVNYVADGHGFRAAIKTNEPGTAPSAPAAASIAGPVVAHVSAPLVHGNGVYGAHY